MDEDENVGAKGSTGTLVLVRLVDVETCIVTGCEVLAGGQPVLCLCLTLSPFDLWKKKKKNCWLLERWRVVADQRPKMKVIR